jgi:hypothetical protein
MGPCSLHPRSTKRDGVGWGVALGDDVGTREVSSPRRFNSCGRQALCSVALLLAMAMRRAPERAAKRLLRLGAKKSRCAAFCEDSNELVIVCDWWFSWALFSHACTCVSLSL